MIRALQAFASTTLLILSLPAGAAAQQEWLCDTQFEDCRAPLMQLIQQETQGIDVGFWFMEDFRYVAELTRRHNAGVPVRVLVDSRANASKRLNEDMLNALRDAGIPMREKYTGGDILHFKMMLFHGQDIVEFSKANYTDPSFVPIVPNVNYFDETIFFTGDDNLTNSFRRRFDDLWVNTTQYRDYANITQPPTRTYPLYSIHPSMNFPPDENYSDRAVSRYNQEPTAIDAIVYRVTDHRQADAIINAVARGVRVRLITEPDEYRNPARVWDAKHVDRMWMGGAQIKIRQHEGLMHQASVVLHGLGEVIFGSSNWTTSSAIWQDEHNYFYEPSLGKPWFFQWFADQFNRKWNDTTNYATFQPLPPDAPAYSSPTNGTTGAGSSLTLTWDGGPWAHLYDIYFGPNPNPPLIVGSRELGSPLVGQPETFTVSNLQPGTTYYWRVVGKTWAQLAVSGPTWSFTTSGTPPPGGGTGSTPFGGTMPSIPGTFQAENFDEGGQFVSYNDADAGNAGGKYRTTDVDIDAALDTGGGFLVGWTRLGEWLQYTVNVATSGTYTLEARVANIGTGATFRVEVDGVDRTGPVSVPNTGDWQTWQTFSVPGIPLNAGARVIRIVFTGITSRDAAGNFNWFRFVSSGTTPPPPPPPTGSTPFGGTPAALPGTIQAENFDDGGAGVAYNDVDAGNAGGTYRTTDVDIAAAADAGGGFLVGWTRAGEWLQYTANVGTTGTYAFEARVANIGTGAKFRVEVDGVDRTGPISVPDTGDWQAWQTLSVPGIQLNAGARVIRIVFTSITSRGAAGNFNWFRFVSSGSTPPPPPPPTGNTPFGGTPAALPGTVQAENFDEGGAGVAYFDTNAGNNGGAYRTTDVDIEPTTDTGGGYSVGWTKTGEWLKYTVSITASGTYALETRVANIGTGATFHVEVDGVDRTGPIQVPNTGAWNAWQTISTPGISLTAGQHVLRVVMGTMASGGAVAGFNWFRFVGSTSSASNTPFGGTAVALPGTIQAENFDEGAAGIAYLDTNSGNNGGAYRATDVDIQPTADTGGGFSVGWTKTGEWLKYTVDVLASGTYELETRLANIGTGATFHIEVDGVNRTGPIAVPNTGAWDAWQTISTPELSLTAGQHVLRVVMGAMASGGAVAGFNWFEFLEAPSFPSSPPAETTAAVQHTATDDAG